MSEQVKFLNIDRYLGKARNRIYRVGVELEGGWDTLPSGAPFTHDGSVGFHDVRPAHVGEMPSTPMDIAILPTFLRTYYPQYVNKTCGMHVHLSFQSLLNYQRLMDPRFGKTILEYLTRWAQTKREVFKSDHHIWERLKGKNQYCQDAFFADAQAAATRKGYSRDRGAHRYTVVNYCHGLHQTAEVRVLPMMTSWDLALEAIQELLNITNGFLVTAAQKEPKLTDGWKIVEPKIDEHSRVSI